MTILGAREGHGLPEITQQSVRGELSTARLWPWCTGNMCYPSLLPSHSPLAWRGKAWVGTAFSPCYLVLQFPNPEFVAEPGAAASRGVSGRRQKGAEGHDQWGKVTRIRGTYFLCCCQCFLPLGCYSTLLWFGNLAPSFLQHEHAHTHTPKHIQSTTKGEVSLMLAKWITLGLIAGRLKHFLY